MKHYSPNHQPSLARRKISLTGGIQSNIAILAKNWNFSYNLLLWQSAPAHLSNSSEKMLLEPGGSGLFETSPCISTSFLKIWSDLSAVPMSHLCQTPAKAEPHRETALFVCDYPAERAMPALPEQRSCTMRAASSAVGAQRCSLPVPYSGNTIPATSVRNSPAPSMALAIEDMSQITQNCRAIEQFGLEGNFKSHLVQPPCDGEGHLQLI